MSKRKVYFIQEGDTGPIKIGVAKNVKIRMNTLQVGNPRTLQVIATMPAKVGTERVLHCRFRQYRIGGEWFHPSSEIMEYIKANAVQEWTKQPRNIVDTRAPKLDVATAAGVNNRLAHLLG